MQTIFADQINRALSTYEKAGWEKNNHTEKDRFIEVKSIVFKKVLRLGKRPIDVEVEVFPEDNTMCYKFSNLPFGENVTDSRYFEFNI